MAERTGVATKLARVLGGRGSRSAEHQPSEPPAATDGAKPASRAKATAKAKATPAKKVATKSTTAKTTTAKTAAKTATAKTATAKTAAKTATAKTTTAKTAAKSTTAKSTKTTPARATKASRPTPKATTHQMTSVTKTAESASTGNDGEYADLRAALVARAEELGREHARAVADINDLQRDRVADGAGDDQADAGTKTFEREQEISLANGILDRLTQVEHALDRLDSGTYGRCERCGNAIPKARLEAFPSVTLCVACKQIEERR
jgi:RNA polymerase-binding transcription factor DksA